jgi:CheY-like chemotaxis protein
MAYGVVTRLGGTIAAENREEGGARFRLVFPRADAAAMPVDDRPTLPPVPRQRVLVVDDEPENLSALQALLESHEQRVELANSGAEALEIARSKPHFDLVLCDVGMPGLSGWQVVEELRRLDPQSRIYLLTGWANEIADDDPRRAMVRGVLGKPVEAREIRRLLAPPSNVA